MFSGEREGACLLCTYKWERARATLDRKRRVCPLSGIATVKTSSSSRQPAVYECQKSAHKTGRLEEANEIFPLEGKGERKRES